MLNDSVLESPHKHIGKHALVYRCCTARMCDIHAALTCKQNAACNIVFVACHDVRLVQHMNAAESNAKLEVGSLP